MEFNIESVKELDLSKTYAVKFDEAMDVKSICEASEYLDSLGLRHIAIPHYADLKEIDLSKTYLVKLGTDARLAIKEIRDYLESNGLKVILVGDDVELNDTSKSLSEAKEVINKLTEFAHSMVPYGAIMPQELKDKIKDIESKLGD